MNTSQIVAKILLELKAVTLNTKTPFKYASGILSPVYTDCRILISFPKQRAIIRDLYIEEMQKTNAKFDCVAGTATAGIPHAAFIADKLNLPMIYVRGKAKDHGKGNQIEGKLESGQSVAVIEDLISTGESSTESAKAINEVGAKAEYVFSIITYQMKTADENFKENNLKLITLTTFEDVVDLAIKMSYISQVEKETILDWIKNPNDWAKKNGFEE